MDTQVAESLKFLGITLFNEKGFYELLIRFSFNILIVIDLP